MKFINLLMAKAMKMETFLPLYTLLLVFEDPSKRLKKLLRDMFEITIFVNVS